MNKTLIFTILMMLICIHQNTFAQEPIIQWEKNFGGSSGEEVQSIQQTSDGGYIAAGYTFSTLSGNVSGANNGSSDNWIVKLDGLGNLQWEKNLGGSFGDRAQSIEQTTDGGYIVAGITRSSTSGNVSGINNGPADYWIIKLDGLGNIQWEKNYGGSAEDQAYSIQQTNDGGYIVAGFTQSPVSGDVTANNGLRDVWILKLNNLGILQWEKNYGGNSHDMGYSIQQTTDGGYIVAGLTISSANGDVSGTSNGSQECWVLKLDGLGSIQWEENFGGSAFDLATSIQQTTDGGYIMAARSESSASGDVSGLNKGGEDFWIVKLDAMGNIQWEKNFGGSAYDTVHSIEQTSDGGYIASGETLSSANGDISGTNNGSRDYWIIKLDGSGNLQWEKNYGGNSGDLANSMDQTSDGGFILAGYTLSSANGDVSGVNNGSQDFWIVKLLPPTISNNDPSIADPCACFDPNNILVNGQYYFHELVTITASPSETWAMTSLNSGQIFDVNGNDISANLPIAMNETPAGSGTYTLDFWHLPATGYSAEFNRIGNPLATPLSMSNSCLDCNNIPTTSEWGLLIFGLMLSSIGIMVLRRMRFLSYEV